MIVLKWYTATHERNGLLLIWSFWFFLNARRDVAVMVFSTGHVFVLAVAGGSRR